MVGSGDEDRIDIAPCDNFAVIDVRFEVCTSQTATSSSIGWYCTQPKWLFIMLPPQPMSAIRTRLFAPIGLDRAMYWKNIVPAAAARPALRNERRENAEAMSNSLMGTVVKKLRGLGEQLIRGRQ
jgi:hypothetical protein